MPRFSFTIRLIRFAGTRIAFARPLMLICSSFRSSSRILPGGIGGSLSLVVIGNFDIGWSLRFPSETDSKLVVDPNAELAFAAAAQCFQTVASECSEVFQGGCGVEANQPSSNLLFDIHQFNDAMATHQLLGSRILERLDHYLYGITELVLGSSQRLPRPLPEASGCQIVPGIVPVFVGPQEIFRNLSCKLRTIPSKSIAWARKNGSSPSKW